VSGYPWLLWVHLLAAATWTGGLIVLPFLILALRRAGAARAVTQAVARQFSRVTWSAMGIAVATGLLQLKFLHLPWSTPAVERKVLAVGAVILVALVHTRTARRSSPSVRGALEALILTGSVILFRLGVAI
jgi:uncharacterized membrane protein